MRRIVKKPLLRSGKSAVVVIPKWWLEFNGLKIGDSITLEITHSQIKLKPTGGGKDELQTEV